MQIKKIMLKGLFEEEKKLSCHILQGHLPVAMRSGMDFVGSRNCLSKRRLRTDILRRKQMALNSRKDDDGWIRKRRKDCDRSNLGNLQIGNNRQIGRIRNRHLLRKRRRRAKKKRPMKRLVAVGRVIWMALR